MATSVTNFKDMANAIEWAEIKELLKRRGELQAVLENQVNTALGIVFDRIKKGEPCNTAGFFSEMGLEKLLTYRDDSGQRRLDGGRFCHVHARHLSLYFLYYSHCDCVIRDLITPDNIHFAMKDAKLADGAEKLDMNNYIRVTIGDDDDVRIYIILEWF